MSAVYENIFNQTKTLLRSHSCQRVLKRFTNDLVLNQETMLWSVLPCYHFYLTVACSLCQSLRNTSQLLAGAIHVLNIGTLWQTLTPPHSALHHPCCHPITAHFLLLLQNTRGHGAHVPQRFLWPWRLQSSRSCFQQ